MLDSAEALELLAVIMAKASALAKSYQSKAVLCSNKSAIETNNIECSEIEAKNAAAHCNVEIIIQNEIVNEIASKYSHIDVICEEDTSETQTQVNYGSPHTLLVDPIDFTRNYIEGGDRFAITAAMVEYGIPIVAVVEFPRRGERYLCRSKAGVLKITTEKFEYICARPNNSAIVVANKAALDRLNDQGLSDVYRIEAMQFTLEDILRCIRGEVSAVICYSIKAHDIAPAVLLALEVGLIVTDWHGHELRFNRESLTADLRLPNGCVVATSLAVSKSVLKSLLI